MGLGETEEDLDDPTPDIHSLFSHYNEIYFHDSLGSCALSWSTPRMTSCTGNCRYDPGGGCEIRLSKPLLKFCSTADLKNTLLHEMIHAFLWIKNKNKHHSDHGPSFQDMMNAINSSSLIDHQKPHGGYNITIYHGFHTEVNTYRCDTCGDLIKKARDSEPSDGGCIEKVGNDRFCSNSSCLSHKYKKVCSSSYTRKAEPPGFKDKKTKSKGDQEIHDENTKVLSSYMTRATRRSCKTVGLKEKSNGKKANTIANYFPSAADAKGNSGNNSSSGDDSQKKLIHEELKAIDLKTQSQVMAPEISRVVKTPASKRKHTYPCKKRRDGKCKKEYTVAFGWLNVYGDEESEEDVEPLINKRTERRKMQKLQENLRGRDPEIDGRQPGVLVEYKMEGHGNPVNVSSEQ